MSATKSFEQNLQALEKIVEKLESGDVPLDEAIGLFQKGKILSKACEGRLKQAELKIQQLLEDEDGSVETAPFEGEDGVQEAQSENEDGI
jgi:exodeoxyribonuclease VII small subunit